jgi:hypothetical protein
LVEVTFKAFVVLARRHQGMAVKGWVAIQERDVVLVFPDGFGLRSRLRLGPPTFGAYVDTWPGSSTFGSVVTVDLVPGVQVIVAVGCATGAGDQSPELPVPLPVQ